jgi:antitoxin ParD1/3/4
MIITLTAELERFVTERMSRGGYSSPEKVIEEGLKLIQMKEDYERRLAELRKDLQIGLDQISRGEVVDGKEAINRIREKIRNRPSPQT